MELKFRIKVIEDYPNNPYPIGEIIEVDKETYESFMSEDDDLRYLGFSKYPKNIHLAQWWEGYTLSQAEEIGFPEYVKHIYKGEIQEVCSVKEWLTDNVFGGEDAFITAFKADNERDFIQTVSLNGWLPATKEQFNTYINKKEHQA